MPTLFVEVCILSSGFAWMLNDDAQGHSEAWFGTIRKALGLAFPPNASDAVSPERCSFSHRTVSSACVSTQFTRLTNLSH